MFQDALATFSTAQATAAASYASTDIVDQLAAGDAYVGNWFVVRVATAYTAPGTGINVSYQLQTANDANFTDGAATLLQSSAFYAATLAAGRFYAARIPAATKRYLRAYYLNGGISGGITFGAGATDAFIVHAVDLTLDKRFQIA